MKSLNAQKKTWGPERGRDLAKVMRGTRLLTQLQDLFPGSAWLACLSSEAEARQLVGGPAHFPSLSSWEQFNLRALLPFMS